jgi:hypothetical protein
MVAFSIPLLPVKVTLGKEKEVASPAAAATTPAFDSRDLAIVCMGVAVVFVAVAVVLVAYSKAQG